VKPKSKTTGPPCETPECRVTGLGHLHHETATEDLFNEMLHWANGEFRFFVQSGRKRAKPFLENLKERIPWCESFRTEAEKTCAQPFFS
jgi:hypothetical protein